MAATFFYPQFVDTLKQHDFSTDSVNSPPRESVIATPDSASIKKAQERKRKKEEREKKKKAEAKTPQESDTLLKKTSPDVSTVTKIPVNTFGFSPANSLHPKQVDLEPAYLLGDYPTGYDSSKAFVNTKQSFFTSHELKAKTLSDPPVISHTPYWINGFILVALVIFVWVQTSYRKRFSRIITAFFNIREFFQLVREEYTMTNGLSVVLSVIYILTASTFVYQLNTYYHIFVVGTPVLFYLSVAGIITVFFLFKLLFVRTIGMIFYNKADQALPFVYNIFLTNNMVGILLLPVSVFLAYAVSIPQQTTIIIAIISVSGLYMYRIARALSISVIDTGVSNLYFFSYLCTLDLVPFIVLLKQLMNRF